MLVAIQNIMITSIVGIIICQTGLWQTIYQAALIFVRQRKKNGPTQGVTVLISIKILNFQNTYNQCMISALPLVTINTTPLQQQNKIISISIVYTSAHAGVFIILKVIEFSFPLFPFPANQLHLHDRSP
jgi:hypothetical protein